MNKNNLIIGTAIAVTVLVTASPALAANFGISNITNAINREATQASRAAERQTNELSNIQQRANILVTNRTNELNKLLTRIQNDPRLTSDEKSSLTSEIQNVIDGLNQTKAKVDADTDAVTARKDALTIFTSYKVYEVVVPQTQLLITIDNLQTTSTDIQSLITKVQALDIPGAQTYLDDASSQLQTINSKLSADKTTVLGVTVSTSNPQTIFQGVRQDLLGVRQNFEKIRSDFMAIVNIFKTSKSSASPTSTSSAVQQ